MTSTYKPVLANYYVTTFPYLASSYLYGKDETSQRHSFSHRGSDWGLGDLHPCFFREMGRFGSETSELLLTKDHWSRSLELSL